MKGGDFMWILCVIVILLNLICVIRQAVIIQELEEENEYYKIELENKYLRKEEN